MTSQELDAYTRYGDLYNVYLWLEMLNFGLLTQAFKLQSETYFEYALRNAIRDNFVIEIHTGNLDAPL